MSASHQIDMNNSISEPVLPSLRARRSSALVLLHVASCAIIWMYQYSHNQLADYWWYTWPIWVSGLVGSAYLFLKETRKIVESEKQTIDPKRAVGYDGEFEYLLDELSALEDQAGISKLMAHAREGRFIPLGATGKCASSEEYFADEYDYFRNSARDAYFSVENARLRMQLMTLRRTIERLCADVLTAEEAATSASYQQKINDAKQWMLDAEKTIKNPPPWSEVALWAMGTIVLGYWAFGLAGAIGSTVGGFLIGQGVVARAMRVAESQHNYSLATLKEAQEDLQHLRQHQKAKLLYPECFSQNEALTGERDPSLDDESTLLNVRCAQDKGQLPVSSNL